MATLLIDPFHLDPLNGYGLLPVAFNGFLAQSFTLLQLHRYKRFSWYLSTLTFLSWMLSTIILWAISKYLIARPIGGQDFEFRSLAHINSCGGSSALSLCAHRQGKSPLYYLFYQVVSDTRYGRHLLFGTSRIGNLIVPTMWVFCTLCLALLFGHQCFGSPGLGFFASRDHQQPAEGHTQLQQQKKQQDQQDRHPRHQSGLRNKLRFLFVHPRTGTIGFYMASCIFFLSMAYQGLLFYNYIGLNLIDLSGWSFGQILAIVVWIPVILDYIYLQFSKFGLLSPFPPLSHFPSQTLARVREKRSGERRGRERRRRSSSIAKKQKTNSTAYQTQRPFRQH